MRARFLGALIALCALTASLHAAPPHQVTLTWTASTSSSVSYLIYRGSAAGAESATAINATGVVCTTACSYVDTNVLGGTTYFYYVESFNGSNNSIPSNEVKVVVPVTAASGLTITHSN